MDKPNRKDDSVDQSSPFNRYFSDSGGSRANFFDEISSSTNVSAMMTSVVESGSSRDLFGSASKPLSSPNQQTLLVSQDGAQANSTQVQHSEYDQSNKEPIVCRIFSDQQEAMKPVKISKPPDKMFFDTLGSSHQSFPVLDSIGPAPRPTIDLFSSSGHGVIGSDFASDHFKASYDLFGKTPDLIEPAGKRESERSRDAWIPSDRTRKALINFATAPPGTYTHERELLTMPGVVLEEDMVDNVSQVVTHFLGEAEASKRKVLTMNDVTQDERGLRELIQAECFRAAVNLTGRLLTIYGQGAGRAGNPSKHTVHSIQLWFTRLSLLVKLRAFSVADAEASVWWDFDHPDLYFQFYREMYGGRLGTLVPFQFRLLIATLPAHLQRHQEALDRLYSVLATVRKMLRNLEQGRAEDGSQLALSDTDRADCKRLWLSREARTLHAIINVALQMKDYSLAIEVLEGMISCDKSEYQKRPLHSVLGRIFLQLGDVNEAEKCFSTACSHNEIMPTGVKVTDLVDQGLIAIGRNSFPEAYQFFLEASKLDPGNIMVLNNMAVCQLYMCNLKEALRLLSDGIRQCPQRALHESLLLNTATLYELHTQSAASKLELLQMVSQYMGDATCVSCLKLKT